MDSPPFTLLQNLLIFGNFLLFQLWVTRILSTSEGHPWQLHSLRLMEFYFKPQSKTVFERFSQIQKFEVEQRKTILILRKTNPVTPLLMVPSAHRVKSCLC